MDELRTEQGGLTPADQASADGVVFIIDNALPTPKYKVEFQFPPRVTDENKKCNWKEQNMNSYEPIAIFMGSDARAVNIEFDYVVNSQQSGRGLFSASKIADILRKIKSYAYNIGSKGKTVYPTVTMRWPRILPSGARCRLEGIGISYSNEKIGSGKDAFPLVTTVKLTLKLVSKIAGIIPANIEMGKGNASKGDSEKDQGIQNPADLPNFVKFEWF